MNRHVGRGVIVLVILAIGFLMSGCASKPQQINISAKPIEKPKLIVPQAEVLKLKELEWIVITESNVDQVWQRLTEKKVDVVLFGITDEGYEILARNMSDIMSHIEQQKAIIAAYKNYYEESEKAIDEANKNQDAINNEIDKVNTKNEDSKPWWDITQ
tara:strand:+ start:612 stop:1085 length:474 start_codon:yes stop_codon:yes gene_type:complete